MCHFITVILPPGDAATLAARFTAHGLGHDEIANPHVAAQLLPGERQILTATGACDCGTPLGTRRPGAPSDDEREVARLRKKGWSEAKIARWREQRQEVRARDERAASERARTRTVEIDAWLAFLRDVLAHAPRVGLLLHSYRGGVETERVTLTRERADLTAEVLLGMREDVLYDFTR